ncbi:small subunit ribosomal protein S1 [Actinopolymorpha cephalotaxi]|uniref:Small subunit ribosomal protein S1 n=1 Tax=Actinopolymorpha cephalotaxi TaxID=504797 RepID=A0A1I2XX35_9ACTN|nr:S1 RNA-binding domain-containing protein [Actinopolymorpha cephalotaxi]NYH87232.1 small subunit ribosomal protein S1 [Actinopolymorpha cephalotaxi]SFH18060.1 small subunit ribosomal protein S1 [Actinopolymorpha cephalotaxi]
MSRPEHSNDEAVWARFVDRYSVGDVVEGDVVSVVAFGAFVRIDAVDGLAPKATWPTLPEVGARVPARIEAIDADNHRFALSPA